MLKKGSRGPEVTVLQWDLKKLGFRIELDGIFGPRTERAVKEFQALRKIKVDGIVGPVTERELKKAIEEKERREKSKVVIIKPDLAFGSYRTGNKPEYVIIHHALARNCTIEDIHNWHLQKGWSGVGYHYFIDKEGRIFQGRLETWVGAHCKEQGMNAKSIGICLEGCYEDYKDQTEKEVPLAQLQALVGLVRLLMDKHKIGKDRVKRHCDFAKYKKCPGNYFPWAEFLKMI